MQEALRQAKLAFSADEVPVGAVIVCNNQIIAKAYNLCESAANPLRHAEIIAIELALAKLSCAYLDNCDLYVTLEPCAMCAAAISKVRINKLIFGAYDFKSGGVEHGSKVFDYSHYKPQIIGGILETESKFLMQNFFLSKR